jgi:cyclophilin family peptidyl-prolyl cis-trans isomerase
MRKICLLFALISLSMTAYAGTLVQFRTTFGDIEVELYNQDKPVTVQNFIRYVQSGRYENEFCHRLVPGFVLQGGGFTLSNNVISTIPAYPPITNEFGVGQKFSNVRGTLAMAKIGGDTNSATSQWFFNLVDNTSLDSPDTNNYFVVFGHVVQGTNILNRFNSFQYAIPNIAVSQPTNLVLYHFFAQPFDTLPVLAATLTSSNTVAGFAYSNLILMDITLLQVAMLPVSGGKEISWNSAAGMTNIVEFTTNFPPIWKNLISTNGNGSRMTVVDSGDDPKRFYRVRVAN